jgi:hypothetical protein
VVTSEWKDEKGRTVRRTKLEPGSLADLEVGRDVYVGAEDDVAVDIIIPPAPPKKDGDKVGKANSKPGDPN